MTEILEQIDQEIEAAREQVAADTIRFINIKSVQGEPLPGAPFGEGPRKMLDEFMKTAESDGFFVTDTGVGVVCASVNEGQPDLGIWLHGDVVPEGDGWSFAPYDAVEYKGCIVGRGAGDNKGQLAAVYNVLKIFKKLDIPLGYNPAVYLGSNEETGMADMTGVPGNPDAKGFVNVCTPPRISLVPDSGFPVGYGGKGAIDIRLKCKNTLKAVDFIAGQTDNPGLAVARKLGNIDFSKLPEGCNVSEDGSSVSVYTLPRHGAHPDPNGNMITVLSAALMGLPDVSAEDKAILSVLHAISLDVYGEKMGIAHESAVMGKLTAYPKCVDMIDGAPQISLNIRYPDGINFQEIVARLSAFAEKNDFEVSFTKQGVDAYLMDKDSKIVRFLCDTANSVTGWHDEPFTLSGATYAHRLPNAYVFGASAICPPEDFPQGHGSAHGVDEVVSVDRLLRMMKIYARALLGIKRFL